MGHKDSPGGPVVKTALSLQKTRVPSLAGELKSYKLLGAAKKFKKKIKDKM